MLFMQSQQAQIILHARSSPLVQVITQPISVISTLHMPIGRQHWLTHMPFTIMQQPSMPFGFIMHSCWSIAAAVLSEHVHTHFIPPCTFSICIVQRGTIMPVGIDGIMPALIELLGMVMPMLLLIVEAIPIRSEVIVLLIFKSLSVCLRSIYLFGETDGVS